MLEDTTEGVVPQSSPSFLLVDLLYLPFPRVHQKSGIVVRTQGPAIPYVLIAILEMWFIITVHTKFMM